VLFRSASTRGRIVHPQKLITSYRSFSCNTYYDPKYTNWGPVVTINDDRAEPGFVTPWHPHRNLDILGYVIEGKVNHIDNLGNNLTAEAGQVQHMWCGDEIQHSEGNTSDVANRYLQIWIKPETVADPKPYYELIDRSPYYAPLPIAFKNPSIQVNGGLLKDSIRLSHSYLLVLEGECSIGSQSLKEGDSAEIDQAVIVDPGLLSHILVFSAI